MLSQNEIIEAMQYDRFHFSNPINTAQEGRIQISYQFAGGGAPGDLPTAGQYGGWRGLSPAEKASFEAALAHIETFLNVDFVQVQRTADPDLNVAAVALPGATIGNGGYSVHYRGNTITQWDGFVAYGADLDLSAHRNMDLLLHEMGHALGLHHTFEASQELPDPYDSNLYSVMSYRPNPLNGEDSDAMMLFDVLALQDIWGAAAYNEGDTTYTGCRTQTVDSLWDSGGVDTLNAKGRNSSVSLDLRQGAFSSFDADHDVVITFGTEIENAFGAKGSDRIVGNELDNLLLGKGGRDYLSGKQGNDRLQGGYGRDTLKGGNGEDYLIGGGKGDQLRGGNGDDKLVGNRGWDRLHGQGGDDLLVGGRGRDTFIFKNQGGNDTVRDFSVADDRLKILSYGTSRQLLEQATDSADGVLFDFGDGNSLLLRDVTLAVLSDDFLI